MSIEDDKDHVITYKYVGREIRTEHVKSFAGYNLVEFKPYGDDFYIKFDEGTVIIIQLTRKNRFNYDDFISFTIRNTLDL
jgi:hypothetical protein